MDNDDRQIGQLLSRREAFALLGIAGTSLFVHCSNNGNTETGIDDVTPTGACVVRPAQTQGPYFVDERLNRSDVRSDPSDGSIKAGTPLALSFAVSRISGSSCSDLASAYVDIWHCDALGVYSDANDSMTESFKAAEASYFFHPRKAVRAMARNFRSDYRSDDERR